MCRKTVIIELIILGLIVSPQFSSAQEISKESIILENDMISCSISKYGITSISSPDDTYRANVVDDLWPRPSLTYKILNGDWLSIFDYTNALNENGDSSVSIIDYQPGMPQKMETRYTLNSTGLDMDIIIESMMKWSFTIGDLSISLPALRPGGGSPEHIFEECFTTHEYISGNGSFIYYARPSGQPPFLMVLPKEGTSLEYNEVK